MGSDPRQWTPPEVGMWLDHVDLGDYSLKAVQQDIVGTDLFAEVHRRRHRRICPFFLLTMVVRAGPQRVGAEAGHDERAGPGVSGATDQATQTQSPALLLQLVLLFRLFPLGHLPPSPRPNRYLPALLASAHVVTCGANNAGALTPEQPPLTTHRRSEEGPLRPQDVLPSGLAGKDHRPVLPPRCVCGVVRGVWLIGECLLKPP